MTTILKSGCRKILEVFYHDKKRIIHLREIARKTKLNENSATRFLKELEKANILSSEKQGNLRIFSLNKDKKAFVILSIFDIEKLDKLDGLRKNAITYFLSKLKEQSIISLLFGSTAKETYSATSDIDIILVMNKKTNVQNAQDYAESQTGVRVNAVQVRYDDFIKEIKMKNDALIQSAITTGYPITNHVLYYELTLL